MNIWLELAVVYLAIVSLIYLGFKWDIHINKGVSEDDFEWVTRGMWIPLWQLIIFIAVYFDAIHTAIINWKEKNMGETSFHQKLFNVEKKNGKMVLKNKKKETERTHF